MPMRRGYSSGRIGSKILITVGSLAAAVSLSGCAAMGDLGMGPVAEAPRESLPIATAATRPTAELEKATAYWGKQLAENPRDGTAALSYARNLKALGRKKEALAVLQTSYIYNAQNREYLSEYGRLALDQGQVSTAAQLLELADDPAKPDWRLLSARGK